MNLVSRSLWVQKRLFLMRMKVLEFFKEHQSLPLSVLFLNEKSITLPCEVILFPWDARNFTTPIILSFFPSSEEQSREKAEAGSNIYFARYKKTEKKAHEKKGNGILVRNKGVCENGGEVVRGGTYIKHAGNSSPLEIIRGTFPPKIIYHVRWERLFPAFFSVHFRVTVKSVNRKYISWVVGGGSYGPGDWKSFWYRTLHLREIFVSFNANNFWTCKFGQGTYFRYFEHIYFLDVFYHIDFIEA